MNEILLVLVGQNDYQNDQPPPPPPSTTTLPLTRNESNNVIIELPKEEETVVETTTQILPNQEVVVATSHTTNHTNNETTTFSTMTTVSRMKSTTTDDEEMARTETTEEEEATTTTVTTTTTTEQTTLHQLDDDDDNDAPRNTTTMNETLSIQQQQQQLPPYLRMNETLPEYLNQTIYLFSHARTDRSGAAMLNAFLAHAYAYHYGFVGNTSSSSSLGICGATKHGKIHEEVIYKWGLSNVFLWQSCPTKDMIPHYHTYVDRREAGMRGYNTKLLTNEWIKYIRSLRRNNNNTTIIANNQEKKNDDNDPEKNNNNITNVAIHIRRGDITPCNSRRYLCNEFYLDLLDEMILKKHDDNNTINNNITIYTEDISYESMQDFVDRNYHIIVGGDFMNVWYEMDTLYDVFIMSASTFSYIPAILSDNLKRIIYVPNEDWKPISSWEIAPKHLVNKAQAWNTKERKMKNNTKCAIVTSPSNIHGIPKVWYNFTTKMEGDKEASTTTTR